MAIQINTDKTFRIFGHNIFFKKPFLPFFITILAIRHAEYLATLIVNKDKNGICTWNKLTERGGYSCTMRRGDHAVITYSTVKPALV